MRMAVHRIVSNVATAGRAPTAHPASVKIERPSTAAFMIAPSSLENIILSRFLKIPPRIVRQVIEVAVPRIAACLRNLQRPLHPVDEKPELLLSPRDLGQKIEFSFRVQNGLVEPRGQARLPPLANPLAHSGGHAERDGQGSRLARHERSEEHTSELQSRENLV